MTTLFIFRNTITGVRMHFRHQIIGSVVLLIGLYSQGASLALCILLLLSQLTTIFRTIRLWLLASGVKETGCGDLVNFTTMIVAFLSAISSSFHGIGDFLCTWLSVQEGSLLLCVIFGLGSGIIQCST